MQLLQDQLAAMGVDLSLNNGDITVPPPPPFKGVDMDGEPPEEEVWKKTLQGHMSLGPEFLGFRLGFYSVRTLGNMPSPNNPTAAALGK